MTLADISIDLGTVALLAFVTWLDGWRRMADGALLVARVGVGPWAVRAPWTRAGAFALVAWWEPFVLPVVLPREAPRNDQGDLPWSRNFSVIVARATRRLRRVRPNIAFLRGLGALLVVWIIVGIPLATAYFGGRGLIYGVIAAFGLAAEIAMIATFTLQMLGVSCRRAVRATASLLSPFGAPRAAGLVAATAVGSLHSLAPVMALMGDDEFLGWVRPWAYDVLTDRRSDAIESDGLVPLVEALPRSLLERAIAQRSSGAENDGNRYCPRCARTYRDVGLCSDCPELTLVEVRAH
jgi:hypothetical protein